MMTSNVGAEDLSRRRMGFGGATGEGDDERAFERHFSPEFRNRLDARIAFAPLTLPVMERIVERMVAELGALLADREVAVELTPAARARLAARGLDPLNGARPLARLIQEELKQPLGEEILFGRLENGGTVEVDAAGEGEGFAFRFPERRGGGDPGCPGNAPAQFQPLAQPFTPYPYHSVTQGNGGQFGVAHSWRGETAVHFGGAPGARGGDGRQYRPAP